MTVSGGLQRGHAFVSDPTAQQFQYRRRYREGYNPQRFHRRCFHASAFQYRRRYREGYNKFSFALQRFADKSFNTEDGIGRATTMPSVIIWMRSREPFQYRRRYREGYNMSCRKSRRKPTMEVSIPKTVSGGLQHCAPEPLGLLAPDE